VADEPMPAGRRPAPRPTGPGGPALFLPFAAHAWTHRSSRSKPYDSTAEQACASLSKAARLANRPVERGTHRELRVVVNTRPFRRAHRYVFLTFISLTGGTIAARG
jgi:hypothetical protein